MDFPTFQKFSMNYYNDPFSEAAARNMPMAKEDENGNPQKITKRNERYGSKNILRKKE